ncbi:MAG: hypothetical protein EBY40_01095 [Marivivens sp.]|nr:hypothetical protein [Marivivens sp.]NCW67374.1 hypothetical protein [Marivivens sp.]NDH01704.1 hypothetical protein [Marivivens sp.]
MELEIWKDVAGYKGYYQVSSHGRVRSLDRHVRRRANTTRLAKGRIMRQSRNKPQGGYHTVNLRRAGKSKTCYVHRLVCEAFHGPCPEGMEASHADDVRQHNYPHNLSWQTHAENIRLRGVNGGDTHGESNGCSRLTDTCVHLIVAMCNSGKYKHREIASMFNVKREAVSKIARGVRWKHIPRPIGMPV